MTEHSPSYPDIGALDCLEFMPLALLPMADANHDDGEHQVIDAETAYVFKIMGSRERAERIVATLNAAAALAARHSRPVAQAPAYPDMEAALAGSNMFSRTSGLSHQIVIDFPTLEAMQRARDALIKASVPAVREFARTGGAAQAESDEIRQLRIDNARLRDEAFLRSRGVAQGAPDRTEAAWLLLHRWENIAKNGGEKWLREHPLVQETTDLLNSEAVAVSSTDRVSLPGYDETMANLNALTIRSKPRCTCAAIVNPNIPHARSCPLSSPQSEGAAK